jgi:hypothetical protein
MNHPEKILRTLDSHLTRPTRLILYGRAALALGYQAPNFEWFATMDVDAILPMAEMTTIETDDQFWTALELTNSQLEPTGLYITHLFTEDQVILSPTWLDKLEPIELNDLKQLKLFRPSTLDLMLTKMMRIDPQDRADLNYLFHQLGADTSSLSGYLDNAMIPDLEEIKDAFQQNRIWVGKHLIHS